MNIRAIKNITLQQKILLMVVGASFIVFFFAVGYVSLESKKTSINNGFSYINMVAEKNAFVIKNILEKDLSVARTLSSSIQSHKLMPVNKWKEVFAKMYEETLKDNPEILSVWDSWELNYIDSSYKKDYGRFNCFYWRENGQIKHNTQLNSLNGDPADYARIKKEKTESLEDPYFYSYDNNTKNQFLMTSIIVSNLVNDRFIGVIGLDISLTRYYEFVNLIKPFNKSYAFLVSNNLKYVATQEKEKIGLNVMDDYESVFSPWGVSEKIIRGEPTSFTAKDINGEKSFFTIKPINVGKSKMSWALVVVTPINELTQTSTKNFWFSMIIGFVGLILLTVFVYFFSRENITQPINFIISTLDRLSQGHIAKDMIQPEVRTDEMGKMVSSLNQNITGLFQKVEFATEIGKGNLDASLTLLSEEDALGKSLINMQESLKKAREEEDLRKIEDNKRAWANEGLAKFSEILRQNNDKFEVLSSEIIKNLVEYVEANQGGLFVYNEEDPNYLHFELASAYAYNRQKFLKKEIVWGEGLIGACAIEKQTIYYTEVPENYIQITSGLGESRPRALLIVPLMIEEKVLGIIELASFKEFEQYQIDFVEKIAQSIASTITSVRTNIKTASLLAKTQQQAEEMAAQEEEMRQNMEELQATQEESARKEIELNTVFSALKASLYIALLDLEGRIIEINNQFASVLGQTEEFLLGKDIKDQVALGGGTTEEYDQIWRTLKTNQIVNTITHLVIGGKDIWLSQIFAPIFNNEGTIYKILNIAIDITETKRKEEEIKLQHEKLKVEEIMFMSLMNFLPDRVTIKDKNSVYLRVNKAKADALKLSDPNEVIGKTDFDYFEKSHAEQSLLAEKELFINNKNVVEKDKKIHFNDGRESWIRNNRIILRNENGEAFGSLVITEDITHIKNLTFELENVKSVLQSIAEKIPIVVYEINKDGIIVNVFGEGLKHLKKSTKDLIGARFDSAFPEVAAILSKSKSKITNFTTSVTSNKQTVNVEHVFFINESSIGGFVGYGIEVQK